MGRKQRFIHAPLYCFFHERLSLPSRVGGARRDNAWGPEVASRCAEFISAGLGCRRRGSRQRIFDGLQPFDSHSVGCFRSQTEHELSELTLCTSALLVFPVPTEQRFRTSGPVNLPPGMQHAPQVREHSMHRGRRNQNKRRRDERCVNCQWFGIPTKRRGWKVNLRQNLDEKNEQQHAQQKNKTAAPLSHHKRSLAEASTQCQWDRGLRHVRAIRGSSLYFR